ncbi:MAG: hypothetical protein KatS3mg105_3454 [Gemmatales bacterium]|nr:MAG: hypothetical protein KatS3mg105_3454 [Gemmatales bacterium]
MNKLYQAALAHFEAKRNEAIATLDIYFNHSVGIGEHSGLLEEVAKWTETLANADDSIEALKRHFTSQGQLRENEEVAVRR